MITTCTLCQARYQLDSTKVPKQVIRVRCPACSGVFVLDGAAPPLVTDFQMETPAPAYEAPEKFVPEIERPSAAVVDEKLEVEDSGSWIMPEEPETPEVEFIAPEVNEPPVEMAPAASVIAPAPNKPRRRRSKEEMLARALVSDILVYNRDLRDTAIKEGKLLEVLGGEIKKSWELYKEKVTPDVANSTNHFREALNEILAEGEKVF